MHSIVYMIDCCVNISKTIPILLAVFYYLVNRTQQCVGGGSKDEGLHMVHITHTRIPISFILYVGVFAVN